MHNPLPRTTAAMALAVAMALSYGHANGADTRVRETALERTGRDAYAGADERHAGSQIAEHEGHASESREPASDGSARTLGNDVSGWQGEVDWQRAADDGAAFTYVKATEGTGYRNRHFTQQYNGSYEAGLIRGAYHFARPDLTSGATQAHYFVNHGGAWTADGRTLPGALDVEYNPYGDDPCYGRSPTAMVAWIKDFSDTYNERTGRAPAIYTSTSWWRRCTGDSAAFGQTNPLWLARYSGSVGELPAGWGFHTIWQYADRGKLPGDQNYFNGDEAQLTALATS